MYCTSVAGARVSGQKGAGHEAYSAGCEHKQYAGGCAGSFDLYRCDEPFDLIENGLVQPYFVLM